MIDAAQRAEIRRLFFAEHWRVGTIAAELGVHHDTVRAAIESDAPCGAGTCRRTMLDPYMPFVGKTLEHYPALRATRLFEMIQPRGYPGSVVQVGALVRGCGRSARGSFLPPRRRCPASRPRSTGALRQDPVGPARARSRAS